MILRYGILSIFFLPLWCQSLLANIVPSRIPAALSSLASARTPLCAIQSPSSESEEVKPTFTFTKQCNTIHGDNINENKQEQRRQRQQPEEQQIYLFSLNWIQESDPEYFLKKDIRRLWEWKDTTLGDGRDFFVPKPKTLMALQQYLLENIPNLKECSIISNCARLEVLCSYSYTLTFEEDTRETINKNFKQQEELLVRDISNCFFTQLDHQRNTLKNSNAWAKMVMQLPVNVDRPESVLTREPPTMDSLQPVSYYDSWWNTTVGPKEILTHICKISAGMGRRPRRPDRPVVFRPFSSRDAHILLQLKRTRENIGFSANDGNYEIKEYRGNIKNDTMESNKEVEHSVKKRKLLPMILDYALRAGKAARNSDIVIEIQELKEMTSAESSVGTVSEQQISQRVANAAYEKGIHPLITECVAKLDDSTNNIDRRIAEFRRNAFSYLLEIETEGITTDGNNANDNRKVKEEELRSWLNRRLHEPTIEFRSLSRQRNNTTGKIIDGEYVGTDIDIESYFSDSLKEIRDEVQKECHRRRQERRTAEK